MIRNELFNDQDKIRKTHLNTFETGVEANLVDSLRSSGVKLISLVAEGHGEVIGHSLFNPVTKEADTTLKGLAPMAVGQVLVHVCATQD